MERVTITVTYSFNVPDNIFGPTGEEIAKAAGTDIPGLFQAKAENSLFFDMPSFMEPVIEHFELDRPE